MNLKRSVEAIKRQIKAEGGPKLARAQAKVDSLVAQLQILNKTTSTKEVEEKTHRKQVRTLIAYLIRTYVTFIIYGERSIFIIDSFKIPIDFYDTIANAIISTINAINTAITVDAYTTINTYSTMQLSLFLGYESG